MTNWNINPALPQIMWIDLNSAFATAEQQAHPSLRHRPVGITNRISRECCIITASYEAKAMGVKTGSRRSEAMRLCPELILLESDPPKYTAIYDKLFAIMRSYSDDCGMKSIDEGYINLQNTQYNSIDKLVNLGYEIKQRVKQEIGDYMTINVGMGSNRFLAKLAAGLHKPDGMDVITDQNLTDIYGQLNLEDLTGIAKHYAMRLRQNGINTPMQFLSASESFLRKSVFRSINGTYWYQRLRGYEVDDYHTNLSVIGRQWVVDQNGDDDNYLSSCLHYLVENVGLKMRFRQVAARGVCVWAHLQNGDRFHKKQLVQAPFTSNRAIWQLAEPLLNKRPAGRVTCLGIYVYNFVSPNNDQLALVNTLSRDNQLTHAIDKINSTYGATTIHSAHSTDGANRIKQKVPFGSTSYLGLLID